MRNKTPMNTLVLDIVTLKNSSNADPKKTIGGALLAATTSKEIFNVLHHNRRCLVEMCADCRMLRTEMKKACVVDLAIELRNKKYFI